MAKETKKTPAQLFAERAAAVDKTQLTLKIGEGKDAVTKKFKMSAYSILHNDTEYTVTELADAKNAAVLQAIYDANKEAIDKGTCSFITEVTK